MSRPPETAGYNERVVGARGWIGGLDGGAPSMKVEVSSLFLLSAHVGKIFTFRIFCSTYIHGNSIVQKKVQRRNWYSLNTYVRTKYKLKILHT
jgi:hypothetical protein